MCLEIEGIDSASGVVRDVTNFLQKIYMFQHKFRDALNIFTLAVNCKRRELFFLFISNENVLCRHRASSLFCTYIYICIYISKLILF